MMQTARIYPAKKRSIYAKVKEYTERYSVIALVKMRGVRSIQLMNIRKILADEAKILMVKNRVAAKALSETSVRSKDKIIKELEDQNLLIFTDINPFKLNMLLEKNKVYLPAKEGDIASEDILVPAGNTGLPPGPILSEFREAKIPTKIEEGTVWIAKDTVVAKAGDIISMKIASILTKLGIKPIRAGLKLHLVLEDGLIYTSEDLQIDVEEYKKSIEAAYTEAITIAVNTAYPMKESIGMILAKAYKDALALTLNIGYPAREVINELLLLANAHAEYLARRLNLIDN